MSKYADIIERLEKATAANYQLERDIDAYAHFGGPGSLDRVPPNYTTSIDEAIALVERMLKTYSLTMADDPSGQGAKILYWPNGLSDGAEIGPIWGVSTTMPIAILLALFRALEAKPE